MKTEIKTTGAPQAIGPYVQGLRSGTYIFCSGQIALDPASGSLLDGGVAAQTRRALENLRAVLTAGGSDPSHVVKTTVYLIDMAAFQEMNAVYAEFFQGTPPARTTIAVSALPRGALVEIDAIAEV